MAILVDLVFLTDDTDYWLIVIFISAEEAHSFNDLSTSTVWIFCFFLKSEFRIVMN